MSLPAALAPLPDPWIGKTLQERYRIVRKLGEGGMGAVYEGEHLLIRKRVAIKLLHPQFAANPEMVARFHQEAIAATAIGQEHIVEVNDLGRTPDGGIFMVLELLQGRDFASLIASDTPLSVGRIARIVMQICEGVQAAHEKGIVHRDLKPENVFLVRRGEDQDFVKVLDFGISKIQDTHASDAPRATTKTGSIVGTAYYMSPEQAQGQKSVDHRTDVWAIGVILFRALTRRYPFEDAAYPMLVLRICTETPPRVRSLRPELPPELDDLVERCLRREVDQRMASCRELRDALRAFVEMGDLPPAPFAATIVSSSTGPGSSSPGTQGPGTPSASAPGPVSDEARISHPVNTARSAEPSMSGTSPNAVSGIRTTGLRNAGLVAAALAVATLAIVGIGALAMRGDPPRSPVGAALAEATPDAPPPSAMGTAPTPSGTPAPIDTPPTTPPTTAPPARIEFIVSPSDALVLIDGRPVAPLADGSRSVDVAPDDLAVHELRIEGRGFRTEVEDLRLAIAQRIVVSLAPGVGTDDRRSSAAPSGRAHPRGADHGGAAAHTGSARPEAPPLLTTEDP